MEKLINTLKKINSLSELENLNNIKDRTSVV